jgi:hypothetical protein
MKTKKEIKAIYLEQKSMNRITDKLILTAIENISRRAVSTSEKPTTKNIVDEAYDLQS